MEKDEFPIFSVVEVTTNETDEEGNYLVEVHADTNFTIDKATGALVIFGGYKQWKTVYAQGFWLACNGENE